MWLRVGAAALIDSPAAYAVQYRYVAGFPVACPGAASTPEQEGLCMDAVVWAKLFFRGLPMASAVIVPAGAALAWFGIGGEKTGRFLFRFIVGLRCFYCLAAGLFLLMLVLSR